MRRWLLIALTLPACSDNDIDGESQLDLMAPQELAERLDDASLQIVDLRAADAYTAEHIPGSIHLDPTAIRGMVDGIDGQVASQTDTAAAFSAAGIRADAEIVAYGDLGGLNTARLLWTLQYYGHQQPLRFLDGGWVGWADAGLETEAQDNAMPSSYAIDEIRDELRVDAQWVLDHLDDPTVILIDARSTDEYDAGHIPGAFSMEWTRNLDEGFFRPQDEVRELYAEVDGGTTYITYCQTGMRGAVDYFTLRWLGYEDVRLYDGSWAEWGTDPDLPKE